MGTIWLLAFGVIWLIELVLFGMQRATLLISRNAGFEWRGGGEFLLPPWYPVTWFVIIAKWGLLLAIAIFWDWRVALGLTTGSLIAGVVIPIPYGAYKPVFRKRVEQLMQEDPRLATQLLEMLDSSPF